MELYYLIHLKKNEKEGRVLLVGDCVSVKKDDLVLYPKYTGTEITHEGQDILIMSEKEILASGGVMEKIQVLKPKYRTEEILKRNSRVFGYKLDRYGWKSH